MTIEGLNRRRLLAGAMTGLLLGPPRGFASGPPPPIADMHTHLGRRTRAKSEPDLAEEMKANRVLLAAWA